jgi:Flp pilus assembly protein TadG
VPKLRTRQPSQAVVEFGLLALLFTLLLFAIVDFGLLLNGWVTVSSAAREGARRAAVGANTDAVVQNAQQFAPVPGLSSSEIRVTIRYCDIGCSQSVCYSSVPVPAGSSCQPAQSSQPAASFKIDSVDVTVTADKFQVVTPLVRPFFGCAGTQANCFVPLNSGTSMRYEGSGLV